MLAGLSSCKRVPCKHEESEMSLFSKKTVIFCYLSRSLSTTMSKAKSLKSFLLFLLFLLLLLLLLFSSSFFFFFPLLSFVFFEHSGESRGTQKWSHIEER